MSIERELENAIETYRAALEDYFVILPIYNMATAFKRMEAAKAEVERLRAKIAKPA